MSGTGVAAGARPFSSATPGSRGASRLRPRPPAVLQSAGPQPAQAGLGDTQTRVLDLERSLQFLQQQHAETLLKLHEEIERLKRENKDLHYKLIMNQKPQKKGSTSTSSFQSTKSVSNSTVSDLAEDPTDSEVKRQLKGATKANSQGKTRPQPGSFKKQELKADVPQTDLEEQLLDAVLFHSSRLDRVPGAQGPAKDQDAETSTSGATTVGGGQNKYLQATGSAPLMGLPPHLRRPATMQQCEVVIRQLWSANLLQAQELQHLKALLKGTRGSKAAAEETGPSSPRDQATMQFPKVATKGLSKCLVLSPPPAAARAVLPALKPRLRSDVAERQRRLQVVQGRRLHRSVL